VIYDAKKSVFCHMLVREKPALKNPVKSPYSIGTVRAPYPKRGSNMVFDSTAQQEQFGQIVQKYAGSAFEATGYTLQDNPLHHMRGLFRFRKTLEDGVSAYVEFQLLVYPNGISRFRVNLLRNRGADARTTDPTYTDRVDTTLSRLLWDVFGVQQLSGADHWWLFNNPTELAYAVVEAGKFALAFAVPWLEGTLRPDEMA
jgi:hypothetical protein